MSIDKNKELFEGSERSVEFGQTMDSVGQELDISSEAFKQSAKEGIERELIKRLSLEKHRLAAEMEIKFKEAGAKRKQAQQQKIKELLEQEQQKYAQALKKNEQALQEKYSRAMKAKLQERAQQITAKVKNSHYTSDMELRQQIDHLQQELVRQQQASTVQIAEAARNAEKEQEEASRAACDNIIQAGRAEITKQIEEKLHAEFLNRELELKREHEIDIKKHTAKLMDVYEIKLRNALFEQEQAFAKNTNEQLARQNELFNHRMQQEIDVAVAAATSKMELEFVKEKQALNAKQRLAEAMQEENMIILRYKEREIREACDAELEQKVQAKIQQSLQDQEKRLRLEHQQQLEQTINKLKADHELQLQAEVIQERARLAEKSTNDRKTMLQQLQANLQDQHTREIAHRLAMQAQSFKQQYEVQITNLETKLQELMSQRSVSHNFMRPQVESYTDYPRFDAKDFEGEKQAALRAQERALRAEYEHKLRGEDVIACEKRLRREFQQILEQQRLQAAANFAKQRDVELRATLARYKQKILGELENARVNDLAAAEEALKEQYAARMQQHAELARVETERTKDYMIAEQAGKIKNAVDLQIEIVRKDQERKFAAYVQEQDKKLQQMLEEERKKINIKFAQDKANLIKDLSSKFTREKHIAMNKYETELREKLYKEMVKQKDFIQTKFSQTQESALQEQKRRLEAQHKHEIERIKQGFFDPESGQSKHAAIIAERSVEQLADRILAKFEK